MDLGGPGLAQHGDHGPGGGAPHDRVVDHDEPLAGDVLPQRVELAPHPVGPLGLGRGDEGAADVAVLDQALSVGDARGHGVALGGRHPRVGHAHDQVGGDRRLGGQQLAHPAAGAVDLVAVERGVGPGEVDELEDAELGVEPLDGKRPLRAHLLAVDDDHLAGLELADEGGADDVERRATPRRAPSPSRTRRWPRAGPRHSGRKPFGSRTPISRSASRSTKENAPSTEGSTGDERLLRGRRAARGAVRSVESSGGNAWASSSATRSLSEETMPGSMPAWSASVVGVGQVAVVGQGEAGPARRPGTPAGR